MNSLLRLRDEELLLVFPNLRIWKLLELKSICKRLDTLVSKYFYMQKVLDFSLPVPPQTDDRLDVLHNTRALVLRIVGPNLVRLRFSETEDGKQLYRGKNFATELAKKCPNLKSLHTTDHRPLIQYCEINGKSVEQLELSPGRDYEDTDLNQVSMLKLCSSLKSLKISIAEGQSISWVSDVLTSRPDTIEVLTFCFEKLTAQLLDEILSIVKCSSKLTTVNIDTKECSSHNLDEEERYVELGKQLSQVIRFEMSTWNYPPRNMGPLVTSLKLIIMEDEFSLFFLKKFTRLEQLTIAGVQGPENFELLAEHLPKTVTKLSIGFFCEAHFEKSKTLLRRIGDQLEMLEAIFFAVAPPKLASMFLLEVADHCPNLKILKLHNSSYLGPMLHIDCTAQFCEAISKLKDIREIGMDGAVVRQKAVSSAVVNCKHLTKVQMTVSEQTFDPVEMDKLLAGNRKLYQLTLWPKPYSSAVRDSAVYQYVNGKSLHSLTGVKLSDLLMSRNY